MISIGAHFESNRETDVWSQRLGSCSVLNIRQGEVWVDLFFPTAEICDAVRDALLKCPGCVARPEVEVPISPEAAAEVAALQVPASPQPAVQAMDAQEEWA